MTSTLTDKQQVWLENYLICWNATEAARKAGYSDPRQSGYKNTKKDYIRAEIEARLAEKKMSADEALARLSAYAKADMTDFLRVHNQIPDATIDMSKARSEGKLFLVKKYKKTKDGHEIELHDPMRALELISKHYGLFTGDPGDEDMSLPPKALELMKELGITKQQLAAGVLRLLEKVSEVQSSDLEMLK